MTVRKGFDWEAAKARLERARLAIDSAGHNSEQMEALYRRRARVLAQPEAGTIEEGERIVVFQLGSSRYAFPLAIVSEVIVKPRIAPAPGSPGEIAGLIQVRGEIRVVWNLGRMLGLTEANAAESGNVLLVRAPGGEAGCLVGELEDILAIKDKDRRPAPDNAARAAWMTSSLVVVLDPAAMFPGRTERNGHE
jgi:purine-binding chemotaxis protein CheW